MMLNSYYKDDLIIRSLSEEIDTKKIVRKTFTDQPIVKCAFVTMSMGKQFQNDRDKVISNCMCYCDASVSVKMRDRAIVNGVEYEVVSVLPDVKNHHKEIYFVQI